MEYSFSRCAKKPALPADAVNIPLSTGGNSRLSGYRTRAYRTPSQSLIIHYSNTEIVVADGIDGTVTLNSGGFETVTTKRKMNQASRQFELGFSVFQHRHQWFVTTMAGTFAWPENSDSIVLDITGLPIVPFAELGVMFAKAKRFNK